MRYMERGGFQGHPLMRITLLWTLLFIGGLWVTNAYMYFTRMSLTPTSVQAYYLGSAEDFSQPKTAQALLEVTHVHLPIMGVVILMLTHLMIFSPYSDRFKKWFIAASFSSAFLGEAAGWLTRFVHPAFAWLKISSFVVFQSCLAFLLVGLAAFLLTKPRPTPHTHHQIRPRP